MFAFLISLPAFARPTSRAWLKAHGWLAIVCALFTLVLGLREWISTLTTRANLGTIWGQQSPQTQSLLQQKVGLVVPFSMSQRLNRFITQDGSLDCLLACPTRKVANSYPLYYF